MRIINLTKKIEATEASVIPSTQYGSEGTGVLSRTYEIGSQFMARETPPKFESGVGQNEIARRLQEAEASKRFAGL